MYIFIALVAFMAYVVSARLTFKSLAAYHSTDQRGLATYGITGMIVAGFVLGSALEHLLP